MENESTTAAAPAAMRKLFVEDYDGTFELQVPLGAVVKTVFEPSVLGRSGGTLLVYEGVTENANLLAIYTGVHGFRDASLSFLRTRSAREGLNIVEETVGRGAEAMGHIVGYTGELAGLMPRQWGQGDAAVATPGQW